MPRRRGNSGVRVKCQSQLTEVPKFRGQSQVPESADLEIPGSESGARVS